MIQSEEHLSKMPSEVCKSLQRVDRVNKKTG
jgi:hypothetical protein